MLRDVTLGRYCHKSSLLHSLDPRTKLVSLVIFLFSVFYADSFVLCGVSISVLLIGMIVSKINLKYMFRGLGNTIIVVLLVDVITCALSYENIDKAIIVTLRIAEVILASNLFTLTTKPADIAAGIEKGLHFLTYIKVPVHDIATMISIAFRFIPILCDEAGRIIDSQKARGSDNKKIFPIIIPLFNSAFKKADDLAVAMDSRFYGYGNTTRMNPLRYSCRDCIFYITGVLYLGLMIVLKEVLCL